MSTLGQGNVLIVADAADDYIEDIDDMVLDNLAAGCTACGVLGASLRDGDPTFGVAESLRCARLGQGTGVYSY